MDFKKGVGRKFNNDMATIEHLIPLARGGEHTFENTVLACRFCNISRGAKSQEEFEKSLFNTKDEDTYESNALYKLFGKYIYSDRNKIEFVDPSEIIRGLVYPNPGTRYTHASIVKLMPAKL